MDPADPQALAAAIIRAARQPELRRQADQHNQQMIAARADYTGVMAQAEAFYQEAVRD